MLHTNYGLGYSSKLDTVSVGGSGWRWMAVSGLQAANIGRLDVQLEGVPTHNNGVADSGTHSMDIMALRGTHSGLSCTFGIAAVAKLQAFLDCGLPRSAAFQWAGGG